MQTARKNHRSNTKPKLKILVLIETSQHFSCQIIEGINRFALEQKNWMLILESRGPNDPDPSILRRTSCNGIIARTATRPMINAMQKPFVPVVELLGDGRLLSPDIQIDHEAVVRMAFEHFVERKLRQFAYFSVGHCWWSRSLRDLFSDMCRSRQASCMVCPCEEREAPLSLPVITDLRTEKTAVQWLKSLPKPVGIFCPEDGHALLLLNLCRINGISVPYDVAVLSAGNNSTLCNATTPRLSSIALNGFGIGYRAARLLQQKIDKIPVSEDGVSVPPLYVATRNSTSFTAVRSEDVRIALQYINDHLEDRFTLEQLAEETGISKRSLIRRFQDTFGHPPEKEILLIRMNRAKELLVETDLSIAGIGRKIGYGTTEYFIRVFHQHIGMTPNQYRKDFLKGLEKH